MGIRIFALAALLIVSSTRAGDAVQIALPVSSVTAKLTADTSSVREAPADTPVSVAHNPVDFAAHGMTVYALLTSILGVPGYLIAGGPDWASTTRYNVEATAPGSGSKSAAAGMTCNRALDRIRGEV